MNSSAPSKKRKLSVAELTIFAMLGALMYCSKVIMEWAPNIHLLGMFVMVFTLVYRKKALIPLYIFVFMIGLFNGFSIWWFPYLYIWTILWGITMLLPQKMSIKVKTIVYPLICSLHGFAYGTLYAPAQALMFGFNLEQTIAWIVSGLPFDMIHGISNFAVGFMILPLVNLLNKLNKQLHRSRKTT
jgi:energy-coupling factor transport system substrate-specific component